MLYNCQKKKKILREEYRDQLCKMDNIYLNIMRAHKVLAEWRNKIQEEIKKGKKSLI